jgi:hypothetical protein
MEALEDQNDVRNNPLPAGSDPGHAVDCRFCD